MALAQKTPAATPPEALANLRDLRVLLDFDDDTATVADWPRDKFGRKLPPDQIARAVRLGLSLWASVLPDMHFRFVNRAEEANLCFRFGDYGIGGYRHDGGMAFLPGGWSTLDASCGRYRAGERPGGGPCDETQHNIILIHKERWAVKAVDFTPFRPHGEFLAWVFDPALPHFARGGGPCRTLREDSLATLSDPCVKWEAAPHFDSLAGVDLASVIEHEFGHTLLGDHTPAPYDCVVPGRRPPFLMDSCVRMLPDGASIMLPGDGNDWWNRRGVFLHDVRRLRGMGYRVSYPMAAGTLVLRRRDGRVLETRDWRAAERAMLWTRYRGVVPRRLEAERYFLVDARPGPPSGPPAAPRRRPGTGP